MRVSWFIWGRGPKVEKRGPVAIGLLRLVYEVVESPPDGVKVFLGRGEVGV
jgi:hypothetical protein